MHNLRSRIVAQIRPATARVRLTLRWMSTMFGVFGQVSTWAAISALPIDLWEQLLGLWLTFKGFRPEAVARLDDLAQHDQIRRAYIDLAGVR